jgi:hypothetical protein
MATERNRQQWFLTPFLIHLFLSDTFSYPHGESFLRSMPAVAKVIDEAL